MELLGKHGISVRELSRRSGVTANALYNMTANRNGPSIYAAQKIAAAFGLTLDELLEGVIL